MGPTTDTTVDSRPVHTLDTLIDYQGVASAIAGGIQASHARRRSTKMGAARGQIRMQPRGPDNQFASWKRPFNRKEAKHETKATKRR